MHVYSVRYKIHKNNSNIVSAETEVEVCIAQKVHRFHEIKMPKREEMNP